MYGNCSGLFSYAFKFFPGTPEGTIKCIGYDTLCLGEIRNRVHDFRASTTASYNSKQTAQSFWARNEIK